MGFEFGPFNHLDVEDINPQYFKAWKKAYRHNMHHFNEDLIALDQQLDDCAGYSGPRVNPDMNRVWAWTWSVPLGEIKAIIVGHKPTNDVKSSGIAFHPMDKQNVSRSVMEIFNLMSNKFHLDVPDYTNYSLQPWINDGVLLVNSINTVPLHDGQDHTAWLPLMSRLLNWIYENKPDVIFMLVGRAKRHFYHENSDGLEEREIKNRARGLKQRVVMVHHPTYGGQHNDGRYKNFADGLGYVYYLLRIQGNRINFKNIFHQSQESSYCSSNNSDSYY